MESIGIVIKAGVKNLDCQVEWEEIVKRKLLKRITNDFFNNTQVLNIILKHKTLNL